MNRVVSSGRLEFWIMSISFLAAKSDCQIFVVVRRYTLEMNGWNLIFSPVFQRRITFPPILDFRLQTVTVSQWCLPISKHLRFGSFRRRRLNFSRGASSELPKSRVSWHQKKSGDGCPGEEESGCPMVRINRL